MEKDDLEKEIHELELGLQNPIHRKNKEYLNTYLSVDFLEFGTSGNQYNKETTIKSLLESTDNTVYEMFNYSYRKLSDEIVQVFYKTKRTTNEKEVVWSQRSSLWKFEDGFWKMLFHQATKIE